MTRLVHPAMLDRLERDFFPQRCRIEQASETLDEYGQPLAEDDESQWTAVLGMETIPCRMAPATGGKRRTAQMTVTDATHVIVLAGNFAIMSKMRAVVDDQAYGILLPSHDAEGVTTKLMVKLVE